MFFDREHYLILIAGLCLVGLIWGLRDTRRVIEAPFLYSAGMALILIPQMYVTVSSPWRVPDEAFWVFSVMVVLCSLGLYYGYYSNAETTDKNDNAVLLYRINDVRLFQWGFTVGLLGTVGYYQVYSLGDIEEWRGWPVYWITLAKLALPGISMMMIAYVQSKRKTYLLCAILISIFPVLAIVNAGRRSMTIILPLIYIVPFLIYHRRLRLPRLLIIGAGVLLFIVVYAFPYWRDSFETEGHVQAIRNKPLKVIIEELFDPEGERTLEIIDGMVITGARYHLNRYEWGIDSIYNSFIDLYIPGGLLGYDFKNSLYIGQDSGIGIDWVKRDYGMSVAFYTAKSGYADLFAQFSFAGALIMVVIGKLFRRVHNAIDNYFDGRAIIFLCFFITLPASVSYGAIVYGITTQVPMIIVMLFAFRWCVRKRLIVRDSLPSTVI